MKLKKFQNTIYSKHIDNNSFLSIKTLISGNCFRLNEYGGFKKIPCRKMNHKAMKKKSIRDLKNNNNITTRETIPLVILLKRGRILKGQNNIISQNTLIHFRVPRNRNLLLLLLLLLFLPVYKIYGDTRWKYYFSKIHIMTSFHLFIKDI